MLSDLSENDDLYQGLSEEPTPMVKDSKNHNLISPWEPVRSLGINLNQPAKDDSPPKKVFSKSQLIPPKPIAVTNHFPVFNFQPLTKTRVSKNRLNVIENSSPLEYSSNCLKPPFLPVLPSSQNSSPLKKIIRQPHHSSQILEFQGNPVKLPSLQGACLNHKISGPEIKKSFFCKRAKNTSKWKKSKLSVCLTRHSPEIDDNHEKSDYLKNTRSFHHKAKRLSSQFQAHRSPISRPQPFSNSSEHLSKNRRFRLDLSKHLITNPPNLPQSKACRSFFSPVRDNFSINKARLHTEPISPDRGYGREGGQGRKEGRLEGLLRVGGIDRGR